MSTEPTDLAPHVETTWAEAFVLELRLRDVPGDVIGDVLSEVESHVVDSGTPAHEAFGDPVRYAAEVAETAARPAPDTLREAVPTVVGGMALIVAIDSAFGWWDGGTFDLTGGTVLLGTGMALVVVVATRFGTPMLRFVLGHPVWKTFLAFVGVMAPLVALGVLGRQYWHIATVPAAPVTLGAVAVLAVTTLRGLVKAEPPDPLLAPGEDRAAADEAARRDSRRLTLRLAAIQVGYLALVLAIVTLVLQHDG